MRVLVVEDSPTVRARLRGAIEAEPGWRVVGEIAEGDEVVAACERLRPDVVSLDIVLRGSDGVRTTEQIMARCPTPILIVSSAENRGETFSTLDALAAGAVDALEKPAATESDDAWRRRFVERLRIVARVRVITHPRGRLASSRRSPLGRRSPRVIAIGASTGGPSALVRILAQLPPTFPSPILLVVHLAPGYGDSFATWLGSSCALPVSVARDDTPLPARGEVVVAPPGKHLVVAEGKLRLTDAAEVHACRPSIDVLFASVARELGASAVGCLLTGMGRDGAAGLVAMRAAGATTLAQDEATSVVWGMPREAVRLGGAEHVLALDDVAPALLAIAAR